jgi:hypothetical protein
VGRTIAKARRALLRLVDDEHGERHAPADPSTGVQDWTDVDDALRSALDDALDRYVRAGGDRLTETISVSTDAAGAVSLAAYGVRDIRSVRVVLTSDGEETVVEPGSVDDGGVYDAEERDLRISIVRRLTIPEDPDENAPLIDNPTAAALGEAFERGVIALAADDVGTKDNESRAAIGRALDGFSEHVIKHARMPQVQRWGRASSSSSYGLLQRLCWVWIPAEQRLQLKYRLNGGR